MATQASIRQRTFVVDLVGAAFVATAVSLCVASAVAHGENVALARVAFIAGILCLGPLVPFATGATRDVLSFEGFLMWSVLFVPFAALILGYRHAPRPAATVVLLVAVAYWVLLGWFEGIAIYV
jgi:hypothetical protein